MKIFVMLRLVSLSKPVFIRQYITLLGIAKVLDNNKSVRKITVKIELEKPKPSKANCKS